jgi:hypothetical protein
MMRGKIVVPLLLFVCTSCGVRVKEKTVEEVAGNQRLALYEKMKAGQEVRLQYGRLDSVWSSGTEYVLVLPDSLTAEQQAELDRATKIDSTYRPDNTLIVYRRGGAWGDASFRALTEGEEEGFRFFLPPEEKGTIHVLTLRPGDGKVWYVGMERKL